MSVLLLLLFGGFLFLGMFFLAADLLKVPYMKTEKALLDTVRKNKKGSAALDAFMLQGAMKLSHVIRMDEYRKSRMKNVLKATGSISGICTYKSRFTVGWYYSVFDLFPSFDTNCSISGGHGLF